MGLIQEMAFAVIFSLVRSAALDPKVKAGIKRVALKIYNQIGILYFDDPAFIPPALGEK